MKRTLVVGLAAIAATLVVACQSAPAATEAAAPVAEQATPASETALPAESVQVASADAELVCRSMKVTGTRFAKRECKTADAWAQYDEYTTQNARESTDKYQRVGTGGAANSN